MKLTALTKVQKYMTPEQKTFLTSSFTEFQSNCCPLIWMFCSKKALHRLNNKHESSLHLMHQDYVSNIITVLLNTPKYLEFLKREVYKYLNGLSSQIINDIFKFRKDTCNLRNVPLIESQHPSTKQYGLECIAYGTIKIWKFSH